MANTGDLFKLVHLRTPSADIWGQLIKHMRSLQAGILPECMKRSHMHNISKIILWRFLTLCFHFSVTESAESSVIFTLFTEDVNWVTAKSRCEDLGQRLAFLDTQ